MADHISDMDNELKQALDDGLQPSKELVKDLKRAITQKIKTKGANSSKFQIELSNTYGYDEKTLQTKTLQALQIVRNTLIKLDPKATEYLAYTISYDVPQTTDKTVKCSIYYGQIQLVDYSD